MCLFNVHFAAKYQSVLGWQAQNCACRYEMSFKELVGVTPPSKFTKCIPKL